MKTVFLLGPCHKIDRSTGELYPAFGGRSRSGRFLRDILTASPLNDVVVVFDNIMLGGHLNAAGRESIPGVKALAQALQGHRLWQDANAVIGFGTSVKAAFEQIAVSARSQTARALRPRIIYLPHPSYILRRPLTERQTFAEQLTSALANARVLPTGPTCRAGIVPKPS